MPFQLRDETGGFNVMYVDNANQMGLGSLPNGGVALTVQGNSLLSQSGNFGCGVLVAGSQAGYEGAVFAPANGTATVAISAAQQPTVTSSLPTLAADANNVVFNNAGGGAINALYAIW
ncbi:hypothetical protein [Granulicella sp. dw_53]|uniref:hypothetical protein n=1 Tax=Granulicella sp. dw_53 TaxID=2719792 RepID=UPI001BD5554E|nr:hypothetical protein [Granulicella sp. dw_53]